MYTPFNYEMINVYNMHNNPSSRKDYNNKTFDYWCRALFQRATSTIKFNLPDEWQGATRDFFYYCLFRFGFIAVFETPANGVIFNPCNIRGRDVFYNPTEILVNNPAINSGSLSRTIGVDCELIKLTPDYCGIWDIVSYHASKLANIDNSIDMAITNSKLAYVFAGKNKATAQAIKKVMDKINKGEPTVIIDEALTNNEAGKNEPWQFLERANLKQSYLTDLLLQDAQTLLNAFDAEIGIPTIPYQKRERMVTDEANSRVIDSVARSTVWFETLTSSIERVNNMFGLNISAELRYSDIDEGVNENVDN